MKRLLIIRVDAIGDYILFRNFLCSIRNSSKFSGWEITLLGNEAWKDLASAYDKNEVDKFIWINIGNFIKSKIYRCSIFFQLKLVRFDIAICPTYSRRFYFEDDLMKTVRAPVKIGNVGDLSLDYKLPSSPGNSFYTQLITTDEKFDFLKNKQFFEIILEEKIQTNKPFINVDKTSSNIAILFPGASDSQKRWNEINFAKVGNYLISNHKMKILICGSLSDKNSAKKIKSELPNADVRDLTGKTSLEELTRLISSARLLISNDTSAVHIAASVNTPTVCIYKGDHYGRFLPYPQQISNHIFTVMPDLDNSNYNSKTSSAVSIDLVDVEIVCNKIDNVLNGSLA